VNAGSWIREFVLAIVNGSMKAREVSEMPSVRGDFYGKNIRDLIMKSRDFTRDFVLA